MINYHYEIALRYPETGLWVATIYANSDFLITYSAWKRMDAEMLAEAFIDGIKMGNGKS
jgi:hypothetical protein